MFVCPEYSTVLGNMWITSSMKPQTGPPLSLLVCRDAPRRTASRPHLTFRDNGSSVFTPLAVSDLSVPFERFWSLTKVCPSALLRVSLNLDECT